MIFAGVNVLGVLAGAVAAWIVGFVWYSPQVFLKRWLKLTGITEKEMAENMKKSMASTFLIMFLSAVVTVFVLARLIYFTGNTTLFGSLKIAFCAWVGFMAMPGLNSVLMEKKPKELYLLNMGHFLVALLVSAIIIGLSW
ncbi:Uncharacterised protein [uncultured archaeon]|nr:Uncharacterised protein [uncultured archaeon]